MLVTAVCAWVLNTYVLIHAPYLRLICFIVVIASTVQFIEMLIKKLSPALFRAMGIFLPLITTNCAILGLAIFATNRGYGFWEGIVYAFGAGAGFTLAMVLLRHEPDNRRYTVDGIHGFCRTVQFDLRISYRDADKLYSAASRRCRIVCVLGDFPDVAVQA
jgi:Na+-translocating ferredoxin:NAD+ oxidoreductase RnfA subunit